MIFSKGKETELKCKAEETIILVKYKVKVDTLNG